MYTLHLLYQNNSGAAYTLKSTDRTLQPSKNIQFLIGDIAVMMTTKELKSFLQVIRIAQKGCQCGKCNCKAYKTIQCNTPHAEINFKVNPTILKDLEDLVLGVLFSEAYYGILQEHHIE